MRLKEWLKMKPVWEQREFDQWVKERWNKYRFLVLSQAIWILHGITIIADIVYLFWGRQNVWLSLLCLLCFAAYLVLCAVFPVYYSVLPMKRDPDEPQIGVGLPLLLHLIMLSMFTARDFVMIGACVFAAMLIMTLLISTVMFCFVPEVRIRGRGWILALILLAGSYGIVGQLNYVTDFSKPSAYMTEITDVEMVRHYGRRTTTTEFMRYRFEVQLKDGSVGAFMATAYQGDVMYVGKDVIVYYCKGGLGVEYVRTGAMYDDFLPNR